MKYRFILPFIILSLFSCSKPLPQPEDYYGTYRIIKIRENGKILNIDTDARIGIKEDLYVSYIDRDGDSRIADEEISAVAYSFHVDDFAKPYLIINKDETPVELLREQHFDLLLRKVDNLGNETIMYLKK